MSHDCQLLNKSVVLVSGGLGQKGENPLDDPFAPDELYDIPSQNTSVLDPQRSLRRIQHVLAKIEDRIWAMGGINSSNVDSSNNTPSKIAEFNPTTNSWDEIDQELQSNQTSQLILTEFPMSAIDCVPECTCGISNRKERIFNGSEAKVRNVFVDRKLLFPGRCLSLDCCTSAG